MTVNYISSFGSCGEGSDEEKQQKKEKQIQFLAYKEFRVHKGLNMTRALTEPLMLKGGNRRVR